MTIESRAAGSARCLQGREDGGYHPSFEICWSASKQASLCSISKPRPGFEELAGSRPPAKGACFQEHCVSCRAASTVGHLPAVDPETHTGDRDQPLSTQHEQKRKRRGTESGRGNVLESLLVIGTCQHGCFLRSPLLVNYVTLYCSFLNTTFRNSNPCTARLFNARACHCC